MDKLSLYLGLARAPFLVLTPACIALGLACVYRIAGDIPVFESALVFIGALAAHISVNALNEYQDFHSGLDAQTQRTPFSGGSGVLPAHPELASSALTIALIGLLISMAVGVYFILQRGMALLPLGLIGLFLVIAYTRWITQHPLLCLVAPGLGFGPLMVVGTCVALTGTYAPLAWVASLVPFFLVNNLLLLNQFPDAEADRQVGRRHLLVTAGATQAARWYALQMMLAFASLIVAVLIGIMPFGALLGLLPLVWVIPTVRDVLRHAEKLEFLIPAMGRNVLINLLTPAFMAIGMVLW
ncbi:MAG: prenyltransferase [Burkholderiaceae bacterium]|jgi:1,4-dihydroxy-2-naphthoate octaprenyltransferase|nr:prenyltransferase [Rhodoferax sp.]MBP6088829.1 prenyltransferase [Polaromonas sp.]HOZ67691.1 prenyltransferase [Burkholderiaceae bacterium]MBP6141828.1 prenyltransferase [Polaromonas sp.]MBP6156328.1 prenyltransferase [Polaromonas sp.]